MKSMFEPVGRLRRIPVWRVATLAFFAWSLMAQEPGADAASKDGQGYRIDKPGTITFTVGVKIKGKVEKPQVMIFLPKEKPVYKEIEIAHSFYKDIMEPLPLQPEGK
jgi:hypothetical protein